MALRAIGFWFPGGWELPVPQRLVDPAWDPAERKAVARYLARGAVAATYRGYSHCRFDCGVRDERMGHADLTDGVWLWPEGLAHYVRHHAVRLPEEFLARALRAAPAVPPGESGVEFDGWYRWALAQEACLDFGGWKPLETFTQFELANELHQALPAEHELRRQGASPIARHVERDALLVALKHRRVAVVDVLSPPRPAEAPRFILGRLGDADLVHFTGRLGALRIVRTCSLDEWPAAKPR